MDPLRELERTLLILGTVSIAASHEFPPVPEAASPGFPEVASSRGHHD
jgi:hypothetical protein